MRRILISLSLIALGVVFDGLSQSVEAGELNVQGSSSTGGNSTQIVGRVNGPVRWSITGAFNDVASVSLGPTGGHKVVGMPLSIRQLATGTSAELAPLTRFNVEKLPDGQTRVFLGISQAQSQFNGGAVTLRRNGALIDTDQIRLNA